MYRFALVQRMALLSLFGGPLLIASSTAVLVGAYTQTSGGAGIASLPEIAWEASLGIYLIAKGFKPSPIACRDMRLAGADQNPPTPCGSGRVIQIGVTTGLTARGLGHNVRAAR